MANLLIGLCGHASSGKDTFADELVQQYKYVKVSLADPLKRICKEVFGFTDSQLWGPSAERNLPDIRYKGLTPRKALQTLGTEWGRSMNENTWIDYGLKVSSRILTQGDAYDPKTGLIVNWWGYGGELWETDDVLPPGVVIPDIRFLNEIRKVKEAGGVVIKLIRAGVTGEEAMKAGVLGHASETEQDSVPESEFDHVLKISEGLDNFKAQIKSLMESL